MRRSPTVAWLLMTPALLWIVGITIFPIAVAIGFSFTESAFGLGRMAWVGAANYLSALQSPDFWSAVGTSMIWLVGNLALQLSLPMVVALFLNRAFFGRDIARTIVLTPWIIPAIVAAIMWRWIMEPTVGVLNRVMGPVLHGPVQFLGDTRLALASIIGINTWRFAPFGIVLMLASLQTIPLEYYEAARIDGSSAFQEFRYVTFPMVGRIVWFVGLLGSVWVFNIVDLIWLLTQGGPGVATQTLPVLVYRTAFKTFRLGYASSMAVMSGLFLAIFGVVYFVFLQPKTDEAT